MLDLPAHNGTPALVAMPYKFRLVHSFLRQFPTFFRKWYIRFSNVVHLVRGVYKHSKVVQLDSFEISIFAHVWVKKTQKQGFYYFSSMLLFDDESSNDSCFFIANHIFRKIHVLELLSKHFSPNKNVDFFKFLYLKIEISYAQKQQTEIIHKVLQIKPIILRECGQAYQSMSKVKQNGESTLSQSVEVESDLFCICLDVLYWEGRGLIKNVHLLFQ